MHFSLSMQNLESVRHRLSCVCSGDTIGLSVMTTKHLKTIGLVQDHQEEQMSGCETEYFAGASSNTGNAEWSNASLHIN